jgi:AcrR family transcriptional regulator
MKSTLTKLRERERETRRNLIIDAAIKLFATKPFKQVGMRDIAAGAGLSPASIYRYFSDRDALFVEALCRESEAIGARIEEIAQEGVNQPVEQVAINFVDYLMEHDSFFQMMTHFMIEGGIAEGALERFNATERSLLSAFDELFRKVGAKGNVRLISHAFFAALNGLLITFRNYPGRKQEESTRHIHRLATLMAEIFREGVSAKNRGNATQ